MTTATAWRTLWPYAGLIDAVPSAPSPRVLAVLAHWQAVAEDLRVDRNDQRAALARLRRAIEDEIDGAALNQCPNDPHCRGDTPLPVDDWCGTCLMSEDLERAMQSRARRDTKGTRR